MAETTDIAPEAEIDTPSEYTTESAPAVDSPARPVNVVPAAATGRRKEAVARVRVRNGTGLITVNGRPFATYFPILTHQVIAKEPLRLTHTEEVYDVEATLDGGGVSGQAGAIRLGIARALIALDPDTRPALKKAGLLARDAREKERRKYGLKKARKAPQYSKR